MSVLNLVSILCLFEETVGQGIGPNGSSGVSTGTEWETQESLGNAVVLPHLASSLGIDSITETEVSPEFVRQRIFQTQPTQSALSNVTFGMTSYFTGSGVTLAAGSLATATALSRLVQNALGGVHYTETCTLTGGGHTATIVNVDDASTLAVGAVFAWEDGDGLLHPRVITDVTGTAITLNLALPAVPADDDLMRGGATLFIDEAVIGDTSSTLGSTFSAVIQKGSATSAGWELNGCKAELSTLTFGRNEFPTMEFNVQAMRFSDPSVGPDPEFPSASVPTPQVIGPDSQIVLSDAGSTVMETYCNGTVSVTAGVPVTPLECLVDQLGTTEGIGLYSSSPADTVVEIDTYPYRTDWHVDRRNRTNKQLMISKNAASGNCLAFFAQNLEITTVAPGSGDFTSSNLSLRAVEHNPDTATTALERSKFRLFIG